MSWCCDTCDYAFWTYLWYTVHSIEYEIQAAVTMQKRIAAALRYKHYTARLEKHSSRKSFVLCSGALKNNNSTDAFRSLTNVNYQNTCFVFLCVCLTCCIFTMRTPHIWLPLLNTVCIIWRFSHFWNLEIPCDEPAFCPSACWDRLQHWLGISKWIEMNGCMH